MKRRACSFLLAALLAACAAPEEDAAILVGDDLPLGHHVDNASGHFWASEAVSQHTPREIRLRLDDARVTPARIDARGNVLVDGDIVIAREEDLVAEPDLQTYSVVVPWPAGNKRWPDGKVPFSFDATFNETADADVLHGIRRAMDHIEELTPVRFNETSSTTAIQLHFVKANLRDGNFSVVGRPTVPQNLGIPAGTSEQAAFEAALHSLLHALGMFHEQQRPDRDTYVNVSVGCAIPDRQAAFSKLTASQVVGLAPYDFDSVMQYHSTDFCNLNLATGTCGCQPVTVKTTTPVPCENCTDSDDADGFKERINPDWSRLSRLDINAIHAMYGKTLGSPESLDHFGHALARGDFDGDGFHDLAVGVPGEKMGTVRSGAVYVFKGTSMGLVPWRRLSQAWGSLDNDEEQDSYGWALAVGDLNNDFVDDLVVGAPGEDGAIGAVYSYLGSSRHDTVAGIGLRPWRKINHTSLGLPLNGWTGLGYALAVGELDANASAQEIAIGAPVDQPSGQLRSGTVVIAHKVGNGVQLMQVLSPPQPAADEIFGGDLATGYVDGNENIGLVIGASGSTVAGKVNAGKVYTFHHDRDTHTQVFLADYDADDGATGASESQGRFGWSVAAGDLTDDGVDDIAIGIPGNAQGVGAVRMLKGVRGGSPVAADLIDQASFGALNEKGDRFGETVEMLSLRPFGFLSLVVGAPGEIPNGSAGAKRGSLYVFNGDRSVKHGYSQAIIPDTTFGPDVADVEFGAAVVAGSFDQDGRHDLLIGVPSMDIGDTINNTGAVSRYELTSVDAVTFQSDMTYWEHSPPVLTPPAL